MAYLIPIANKIVPDVDRQFVPLPVEGRNVDVLHQYWLRRIEDGDVTESATAPTNPEADPQ